MMCVCVCVCVCVGGGGGRCSTPSKCEHLTTKTPYQSYEPLALLIGKSFHSLCSQTITLNVEACGSLVANRWT